MSDAVDGQSGHAEPVSCTPPAAAAAAAAPTAAPLNGSSSTLCFDDASRRLHAVFSASSPSAAPVATSSQQVSPALPVGGMGGS
eukprot:2888918-Rhodomonas_salina.1